MNEHYFYLITGCYKTDGASEELDNFFSSSL